MKRFYFLVAACAALLLLTQPAISQQDATPAEDSSSTSATEGQAKVEFDRLFYEWKDLLAQLKKLYTEYQIAKPSEREKIEEQYPPLVDKAMKLRGRLLVAAEKAYQEAPNVDQELAVFLRDTMQQYLERDAYEDAFRCGQILIKGKHKDQRIYNWTGVAAYCLNDLDTAEKYFKIADAQGVLEGPGLQFYNNLPRQKKLWAEEKAIREKEAKNADDPNKALPRVLLKTNRGDIVIELFEDQAPNTVANFISLVEDKFYDGLTFHRVLENFMAQGGCPKGDGTAGPGYSIPCELPSEQAPGKYSDYRKHFRGTLSMAHAGRDTGGSQFFLTFLPTPHLDGRHTAFGRVVEGMDVLQKLKRRDPSKENPPEPDKIIEAKVIRKRPHPYKPKKIGE